MIEQELLVKVAENVHLLAEVVHELVTTAKLLNDRVYQLEQWVAAQGMRQ